MTGVWHWWVWQVTGGHGRCAQVGVSGRKVEMLGGCGVPSG